MGPPTWKGLKSVMRLQVYTYLDPFLNGQTRDAVTRTVQATEILDNCLMGYQSFAADGLILAAHSLTLNDKLNALVAHRPGVIQPTVAARMAATVSATSGGRLDLHIVNGGAPGDQYREGDYLPHDDRYRRAHEYVQILRAVWASTEPVSHQGEFYRFEDLRPGQKPAGDIRIHMGGASPAALEFGGAHADVYLMWGEPLAGVRERAAAIEAAATAAGRARPRLSLSLRLYLGDTDEQAWELARSEPAYQAFLSKGAVVSDRAHSEDAGRNRQLEFARANEVHDDCLWMGIVAALRGLGNAAAVVGTEDRIMATLQNYVDAGIDTFLVAGVGGYWSPELAPFIERMRDELVLGRHPQPAGA